jgi:hypothetical protein|uniref:Uncharacterized protein n=1 Tax=Myoviridae sp. ctshb19 TaxID=2825194 RepID=A0A8S5UGQ7_9CAUD|nr:MAG TPA: hypothetical protein [Myoviridae sp. ctshb19]
MAEILIMYRKAQAARERAAKAGRTQGFGAIVGSMVPVVEMPKEIGCDEIKREEDWI